MLTTTICGQAQLPSFQNMMKTLCWKRQNPEVLLNIATNLLTTNGNIYEAYQVCTEVISKQPFCDDINFNIFYGQLEYVLWKLEYNNKTKIKSEVDNNRRWGGDEEESEEEEVEKGIKKFTRELSSNMRELSKSKELSSDMRKLSKYYKGISSDMRKLSNIIRELSSDMRKLSNIIRELSSDMRKLSNIYKGISSDMRNYQIL